MILLIDNYDSFSFNLVQMVGELVSNDKNCVLGGLDKLAKADFAFDDIELKVIRNDELDVKDIIALEPSHIILSPGPGKPIDAGNCEELIRTAAGKMPILGVCLGHQAICEVFGGKITYAPQLMHGKQSRIKIDTNSVLFKGLPEEIDVARYHSLVADKDMMSEELKVTAVDEMGEVMAVQHKIYKIYGVQFHPESIMTPMGKKILQNFLADGK